MTQDKFFRLRIIITVIATLLFSLQLLWEYTQGGVATHYLLHNDELPGFSNWLGLLVIPIAVWFLLYRVDQRLQRQQESGTYLKINLNKVLKRFLFALLFGIAMSILFTKGYENVMALMMLTIIISSFFIPLYLAEYLLGFIGGMTFIFGSILPILIGGIVVIIAWSFYAGLQKGIPFLLQLVLGKKK